VALPSWFFAVRGMTRQLINFLHNVIIIVAVVAWFGLPVGLTTLLVIPGFALVVYNLLWITYVGGVLGARFRDLEHAVTAILPLLFFMSPVLFRAERSRLAILVWCNPVSHLIEGIRAPLLGQLPWAGTVVALVTSAVLGSGLALWLHARYGRRIAFWV
jgi:ABC-type polysaccharide/polyol phosphate export permease